MLTRDVKHGLLGGVCAGLGEHFGLDPLVFRLAFAGSVLFFGFGILPYLIMWLVIPSEKEI